MRLVQLAQCRQIHVVEVIVADDDHVDRRQIGESQPGGAITGGPDPGERTGSLRPDRIRQQIDVIGLYQHRGVIDEGDLKPVPGHPLRWWRIRQR